MLVMFTVYTGVFVDASTAASVDLFTDATLLLTALFTVVVVPTVVVVVIVELLGDTVALDAPERVVVVVVVVVETIGSLTYSSSNRTRT